MVRVAAVFIVGVFGCGNDEPRLAYAPVKEKPKMQAVTPSTLPSETQEKSKLPEPVKPPDPDAKYTEKVTVRPYGGPGRFLDPHKDKLAYPVKLGEYDGFALKNVVLYKAGSEIEQADGTIWIVVKSHPADNETRITVTKKPKK